MKTIVCGTHFSVHAQEAANAAAALARRFSAALVLVHVHDAVARESGAGLTESAAHEQLAREAKRLRETGATVEEEFATGSPAAVLTETAQRREAGLLVVSTIGQIAPSRFVAGSVAEQAAETSSVPTLVIRRSLPFEEWARGERPLKIFLAYDFSATADNALRWLGQFRDSACEITVAYAAYPPQESWRLGIGEHTWLPALPPPMQRLLQSDIEERVAEILGQTAKIRVEATWGRADPVLLELARETEADLIVVGTHQRHGFGRFWLGSVSRAILRDAPINVATVPRDAVAAGEEPAPATIRRVLVTTDLSELGNRAIPHAFAMLPCGGSVCLVHVVTGESKHGSNRPEQPEATAMPDHPLAAKVRTLIPSDADARDIAARVEVIESDKTAAAICQAAERFDADVICIASHGRSGMSKAILGSVAQDVMARSHRPVLVVRPENR
jgi:nucleotide-binding universal stress UspA family protein